MIEIVSPSPQGLARAIDALRRGNSVAIPTETVYGLGADATSGRAVAGIYSRKGRPSFNPLIIHTHDAESALALGQRNAWARALADALWPGPLTMIVQRKPESPISSLATAGLDTIALRVPQSAIALDILRAFAGPLAAPSANISGRISPTTAQHVAQDFAGTDLLIVDGGPAPVGLESTVIDLSGANPVILRPGAILAEDIARVLGIKVLARSIQVAGHATGPTVTAPGQLVSHYAPKARVRLDALTASTDEALLAFGPVVPSHPAHLTVNLSPTSDLSEAASRLFDGLRQLDAIAPAVPCIAVMPIPNKGLGLAINDRLRRAAAEN